jgi:antibiotic biosynthesis monooxygenase (ABM) superfamily enzyme
MPSAPVSVVVRRRAKPGAEADFERAMQEFTAFALAFPGNRGIDVLRPQPGGSREYTVVDHFVDSSARKAFKEAPEYRAWMTRLRQLTEQDPYIEERDGRLHPRKSRWRSSLSWVSIRSRRSCRRLAVGYCRPGIRSS